MKRAAILVVGCLLLTGCGDSSSTDPATTESPAETPSAKAKPVNSEQAYRTEIIDCLEGVAYKITTIGPELRVSSGGGRPISDIATFPTRRAAQAFQAQLLVEGTTGGQGVATFLVDADDRAKRVVTDCLSP